MATYKFVRKSKKSKGESLLSPAEKMVSEDILSVFSSPSPSIPTDFPMEKASVSDDTVIFSTEQETDNTVVFAAEQEADNTVVFATEQETDNTVVFAAEQETEEKSDTKNAFLDWIPEPPRAHETENPFSLFGLERAESAHTTPLFVETITKESLTEKPQFEQPVPQKEEAPSPTFSLNPLADTSDTPSNVTADPFAAIFDSKVESDSEKENKTNDFPPEPAGAFASLKSFFFRKEADFEENEKNDSTDALSLFSDGADEKTPNSAPSLNPSLTEQNSMDVFSEKESISAENVETASEFSIPSLEDTDQPLDDKTLSVNKPNKGSVVDAFLKMYGNTTTEPSPAEASPAMQEAPTPASEEQSASAAKEENDTSIPSASRSFTDIFGDDIYDDFEEPEEEKPAKKSPQKDNTETAFLHYSSEEYTSGDQTDEINERIRARGAKHLADVIFCAIYTLVLFYIESGLVPRPKFLQPGIFGIFMLLVDSLFLILATIQIFPILQNGFAVLKNRICTPNTVTAVIFITCMIHLILNWLSPYNSNMQLFSSLGAMTATVASFINLLQAKQHYLSFRVLTAGKTTLAAIADTDSQDNASAPSITLKTTSFVNGFVEKANRPPRLFRSLGFYLLASLLLALIFAVWGGVQSQEGGLQKIISGASVFLVTLLLTTPLCSLFTIIVPYYRFSRKMSRNESALLSLDALDSLTESKKLSFSDEDLFPQKGVTLASIRTYGNHQIDHTLLYAARIFRQCGGPLARVFEESLQQISDADLQTPLSLKMQENGISTQIDGNEILVGTKEFMVAYDFGYIKDDIDDTFEQSSGRIMYMTVGDEIAAKFYIRYTLSRSFERILRAFGRDSVETVVFTRDPNLNDAFLAALLKKPIAHLHIRQMTDAEQTLAEVDSDLISNTSVSGLLRSFFTCRNLKNRIRWNNLIKLLTIAVGLAVSLILAFNAALPAFSPLFIFVYQLVWLLPVTIPTFME